jgi:ATP-dependent Lon protease
MRESARLGMTWLKAQMGNGGGSGSGVLERLVGPVGVRLDSATDVHIHVPAGAIPKVSEPLLGVCVGGGDVYV